MFEAINDQLDWLYGEMDLLLPSLYGMGALTPPRPALIGRGQLLSSACISNAPVSCLSLLA